MNCNNTDFKFGYLMGAVSSRGADFDDVEDFVRIVNGALLNWWCKDLKLTFEMVLMLCEIYCSDIVTKDNVVYFDEGNLGAVRLETNGRLAVVPFEKV